MQEKGGLDLPGFGGVFRAWVFRLRLLSSRVRIAPLNLIFKCNIVPYRQFNNIKGGNHAVISWLL